MSVAVVEAIADAIMQFEGWGPDTRSYRNRNPGNLRAGLNQNGEDPGGYAIFPCFEDGYRALEVDLLDKIEGRDREDLNAESTLADLFSAYAPSSDHNRPTEYARFVAGWLQQVYHTHAITYATRIRHIYEIVGQGVPVGQSAA